ncbi:MAG: aminoglycoside phosphotransferase family protein [Clostridiales bacterium]|nr:aminoglycoside phosphotransferase family protein [Clostridiales bacterium]
MEKIINQLIDDILEILPIGHHELKRHLVYRVITEQQDYVVKFFSFKNRLESEVKALQLLENSHVPVPKVINYGVIEGHDYMLYHYEEGITLDKVIHEIDPKNLETLYRQAGIYLKQIHTFGENEPYGRLAVSSYNSHKEAMAYEISRIYNHLRQHKHPDEVIIDRGIQALEDARETEGIPIKGLCHMDYNSRNILVKKVNSCYEIIKIIDFEQAAITDIKRDLVNVYQKFIKNKHDLKSFSEGYGENISGHVHSEEAKLYHLHYGLSICSWSLPVDTIHYQEGIDILKEYTDDRGAK